MTQKFDRSAEDLGNIVQLEHVNFLVPDQRLATLFYIIGLGLTRDPYLVTGVVNMWVNVGRSQFHLPVGDPQKLRGRIGLVVPDLAALAQQLEGVRKPLEGTQFDFTPPNQPNGHIDVTCPWGNLFRCHAPGPQFEPVALGMAYVQFDVPAGTADGIARFYGEVIGGLTSVGEADGAPAAHVVVGHRQSLVFRESDGPVPDYDGHHFQLYVADFSGPHVKLDERGLITEESNQHQYRFNDIVDPSDGAVLYTVEHEIRSMTHPLFARPTINRNPEITNNAYAAGYQDRAWSTPLAQ